MISSERLAEIKALVRASDEADRLKREMGVAVAQEREGCARVAEREAARHSLNAKDPARGCDRTLAEEREIAAHQCAAAVRARAEG